MSRIGTLIIESNAARVAVSVQRRAITLPPLCELEHRRTHLDCTFRVGRKRIGSDALHTRLARCQQGPHSLSFVDVIEGTSNIG
ncbi:MAG: hypothetical protein ACXV5C_09440 [Halobacteriota archaeon]